MHEEVRKYMRELQKKSTAKQKLDPNYKKKRTEICKKAIKARWDKYKAAK